MFCILFAALSLAAEVKPLIIAHRGASVVAPENTVPAIQAAVKVGADGVEWDTRTTADGHLILQHDDTLKRFVGKNVKIADLTFQQARSYDVGSWFAKRFAGTKMPTLREALETALPRLMPFIERKSGSPEQHLKTIRQLEAIDKVAVISFDWNFLARLRQLEPKLKIGTLGSKTLKENHLAAIRILHPEYVIWKSKDLRKSDIQTLHNLGTKVIVWTVDDPQEIRKFTAWGIDGIITNNPAQTRKSLGNP